MPFFQALLLFDRIDIDIAQALDLAAKLIDLIAHALPIHVLFLMGLVGFFQIDLQLVLDPFDQILLLDFELAQLDS